MNATNYGTVNTLSATTSSSSSTQTHVVTTPTKNLSVDPQKSTGTNVVAAQLSNNAAYELSPIFQQSRNQLGATKIQQQLFQHTQQQFPRQLTNNNSVTSSSAASILSKSLTSPSNNNNSNINNNSSNNRSGLSSSPSTSTSSSGSLRVFANATTIAGLTNFGNGHQNGPTTNQNAGINQNIHERHGSIHNQQQIHHTGNSLLAGTLNSVGNSGGGLTNNQTIIIAQKHHSPSNILPGLIAQNKLANLARVQQQQAHQLAQMQQGQAQISRETQQIPASGEITLNSNRWASWLFFNTFWKKEFLWEIGMILRLRQRNISLSRYLSLKIFSPSQLSTLFNSKFNTTRRLSQL